MHVPKHAVRPMISPDGGGQFGGILDFAKSIIPSKTIVGKLLGGDIAGAATGVVKLSAPAAKAPKVNLPATSPGVFSPGGLFEKYQMPLLLVAAGLGAFLIFGRKRGR